MLTYFCPNCEIEYKKIVEDVKQKVECKCGWYLIRIYTVPPVFTVTEKRDYEKNKNITKDIEGVVAERSKKHFLENYVHSSIEKIAKAYGEKEALAQAHRNGWIDRNTGKVKKIEDFK